MRLALILIFLYAGVRAAERFAATFNPVLRTKEVNMRRTIILTLALLLGIAGTTVAQSYPDELAGDQFFGTAAEDLLFTPTEYFQIPYSIPMDNGVAFLTDVYQPPSPPISLLNVHTKCLWNKAAGACQVPIDTYSTYIWDPDVQSYCDNTIHNNGSVSLDCYVFDGALQQFQHYYGFLRFTGSPPQWWDWGYFYMDEARIPVPASPKRPNHQPMAPVTD